MTDRKIAFNQTILDALEIKEVAEVQIITENLFVPCRRCYFFEKCNAHRSRPCMGHNREDGAPVYYVEHKHK